MRIFLALFYMFLVSSAIISRSYSALKSGLTYGLKYYLKDQFKVIVPRGIKDGYKVIRRDLNDAIKIKDDLKSGLKQFKKIISYDKAPDIKVKKEGEQELE